MDMEGTMIMNDEPKTSLASTTQVQPAIDHLPLKAAITTAALAMTG